MTRPSAVAGRLRLAFVVALFHASCRRANQVGDHVLVDWRGGDYPAVIVGIEGTGKFRVHFDGYSEDWDETLPATRVKGRLSANPGALSTRDPPSRAKAEPSVDPTPSPPSSTPRPARANLYHAGERVRVEWHGSIYPATILEVEIDGRYRVHYDGFGNEWDETIGAHRIQRRGN